MKEFKLEKVKKKNISNFTNWKELKCFVFSLLYFFAKKRLKFTSNNNKNLRHIINNYFFEWKNKIILLFFCIYLIKYETNTWYAHIYLSVHMSLKLYIYSGHNLCNCNDLKEDVWNLKNKIQTNEIIN